MKHLPVKINTLLNIVFVAFFLLIFYGVVNLIINKPDELLKFAPVYSFLVAIPVAIYGWNRTHALAFERDQANKRRELITTYLLEAYRRLESAANRNFRSTEQDIAFESEIADIQLLGSVEEVEAVRKLLDDYMKDGESVSISQVLVLLRDNLRQQLQLPKIKSPPRFFRFKT